MNNGFDETQAHITCACGEVFQVLKSNIEMKKVEIYDELSNFIGVETVPTLVMEWIPEATTKLANEHSLTCKKIKK